MFQEKKASIACISEEIKKKDDNDPSQFVSRRDKIVDTRFETQPLIGVLSLKDIFEEIIKGELLDNDAHMYSIGVGSNQAKGIGSGPAPGEMKFGQNLVRNTDDITEATEETEQTLTTNLLK